MSAIISEFDQRLESQEIIGTSEWIRTKTWEERRLLIDYLEKYDNQGLTPDNSKLKSIIRVVQYCLKSVTDIDEIDFDFPNLGEEEMEELLTLYSLHKPNKRYEEIKKDIASPESFLTRIPYPVLYELYKREKVPFDRQIFVACLIRFNVWHWTTFSKELSDEAAAKFEDFFPQDAFTLDILMAVFEMELGVNGAFYINRDFNIGAVLIRLVRDGKIERKAIQQKIFEAFNNPTLKKTTHGWAKNVYNGLDFSKEENLNHQNDLIGLLHNDRNTLVNFGIQQIKKISNDAKFDWEQFIDSLDSIVYRKKLNGGLKTAMSILSKKFKKDSKLLEDACVKLAPIFLQEEPAVQLAAVKCFDLLGKPNEAVIEALNPFVSTMHSEVKEALKFLLLDDDIEEETAYEIYTEKEYKPELNTESNKIKYIENEDDFIFLCTKVLKSQDPLDYELFLEGLLRFYKIKETHRKSLQAALKSAKKMAGNAYIEFTDRAGIHNGMAAKLICVWLDPKEMTIEESIKFWEKQKAEEGRSYEYTANHLISIYQYFKRLKHVEKYLKGEENQDVLPFLSIPTHLDGSITSAIFFDRLKLYEAQNEPINEGDFIIALCRLRELENLKIESKYQSEYREVVHYLLDNTLVFESGKMKKLEQSWHTAFILKNPELSIDSLIAFQEGKEWWLTKPIWDWSVDRYHSGEFSWGRLNYNIYIDTDGEDFTKIAHNQFAFYLFKDTPLVKDIPFWFYKDIYQLEPIYLSFLLRNNFTISYLDAMEAKLLTAIILQSVQRPMPLGKAGTLFLCISLFSGTVPIRNASMDWLFLLIDKAYLRLDLFVESITKMISNESNPVPIKRVKEQFDQLLQFGGIYVDVLYKVLESILLEINSENLPKSFKNILHHYYEVLSYVNAPIPEKVRANLEKMKKLNAIKKEVKKLLEL